MTPRFRVLDHEIAANARNAAGNWVYVRSYELRTRAAAQAKRITNAATRAYEPAGAFETRIVHELECWPYRPEALYVRCVLPQEA